MNERIKLLAEQVDKEFNSPYDRHKAIERFAELIVRECLLCCERTISDPVPESVDTFEEGGIHCMDEIRQHFGVE